MESRKEGAESCAHADIASRPTIEVAKKTLRQAPLKTLTPPLSQSRPNTRIRARWGTMLGQSYNKRKREASEPTNSCISWRSPAVQGLNEDAIAEQPVAMLDRQQDRSRRVI